jgi:hypothetical protein
MKWKARPSKLIKDFWQKTEKLVDWAWEPVDGQYHCQRAYKAEPNENYASNNRLLNLVLMSSIIIYISFWVGAILHLLRKLGYEFNTGKVSQNNSVIYTNKNNHLKKGNKKILWIFIALIMLPICIVFMALIIFPIFIVVGVSLIFLIIMALILIPVGIVGRGILNLLRKLGFMRLNPGNA